MTTFDERERAFENKFAHDAEMVFKAEARRNRYAAEWAAGILGIDARDYTTVLIKADLKEAGFEDVLKKLVADLGEIMSEQEIRAKLNEFGLKAKDDLMADPDA